MAFYRKMFATVLALDHLQTLSREQLQLLSSSIKYTGLRKRLLIYVLRALKYALISFKRRDTEAAVLFLYGTFNQREALRPLAASLSKSVSVEFSSFSEIDYQEATFPLRYAYIKSIRFALPFFFIACRSPRRDTLKVNLDKVILAVGFIEACRKYFLALRPSFVILSNDHNLENRLVVAVATELKIRTIYVQHAEVSDQFPPLSQFDIAFLNGAAARDVYASVGNLCGEVHLVGNMKLDMLKRQMQTCMVEAGLKNVIGFAYNLISDSDRVMEFVRKYNERGVSVLIRLHPRQNRDFHYFEKMYAECDAIVTRSTDMSVAEFLAHIDILCGGNSSVLLESVILGRLAVQLSVDPLEDYYGFLKRGVVISESDLANLTIDSGSLAQRLRLCQERARYFDSSLGTQHYGYSALEAAKLIGEKLRP